MELLFDTFGVCMFAFYETFLHWQSVRCENERMETDQKCMRHCGIGVTTVCIISYYMLYATWQMYIPRYVEMMSLVHDESTSPRSRGNCIRYIIQKSDKWVYKMYAVSDSAKDNKLDPPRTSVKLRMQDFFVVDIWSRTGTYRCRL